MPTFKPEVDQVYSGVRKLRRKRRTRFVIAVAVVLAVPAVWFGVDAVQKDKPPAPAADSFIRRVNVAGVTIPDNPVVTFINANTGFAVYSPCRVNEDPMCRHFAGVTTDRGRTWRSLKLPDMPGNFQFHIFGTDASNFFVSGAVVHSNTKWSGTWVTRDGGATYLAQPDGKVPDEFKRAGYGGHEEYSIDCPGEQVKGSDGIPVQPEKYVPSSSGCTTKLTKLSGGPVSPQPPDLGLTPWVVTGGDGRIWLATGEPGHLTRLRMSSDEAKTWKEMPEIPPGAWLRFSPDGTEVFYMLQSTGMPGRIQGNRGQVARLDIDQWRPAFEVPQVVNHFEVIPVGDGAVLYGSNQGEAPGLECAYLTPAGEVALPALITQVTWGAPTLADGTIVLQSDRGIYLGVGTGIRREWTFISY